MTQVIINDTLPYTQVVSTAGQTVYSTNWTANYASDVVVYYTPVNTAPNDIAQILAYPAAYSVAFIGGGQTVQVTLVTPAANNGDLVTITRMTPAARENLYTNTNFTPSMLNNDFGILTLVDQQAQLVNQAIAPRYNYSALINQTAAGEDTILPILGASQVWVKNPGNTAIVAANINTVSSGSVNLGTANQLAYYATTGTVVSGTNTFPPGLTGYISSPLGFKDSSGNILVSFGYNASAVNYFTLSNAATATNPVFAATGSDSVVAMALKSKGGIFALYDSGSAVGATLEIYDAAGSGFVGLKCPTTLSPSVTFTLPGADALGVMQSDGSASLSLAPLNLASASATAAFTDISGSITVTGFSGTPTVVARQCVIGKIVHFEFSITGTSNAAGFTITGMPKTLNSFLTSYIPILITDNGTNALGMLSMSGTTVTFYNGSLSTSFTSSGTKSAYGSIWYEST